MTSVQKEMFLRKLGANERVVWQTIQAGSINFAAVARISGYVDEAALRTVLDLLSQRHPLLRTRIDIQQGEPVFTSCDVPEIPLRSVRRTKDTQWQEEAERELNTVLPWSTGPLLRVVLLQNRNHSDIVTRFHHVMGDGTSGMYLMHDLIKLLGSICNGKVPTFKRMPERPPVEELLPHMNNLEGMVKSATLASRQMFNIIMRRPRTLPIDRKASLEECFTRIVHCTLSKEETGALIERCRRESTSVHGAICAAMLMAASKQICNSEEKYPITLNCMSPVDLRPYLNPPLGEELGFYASMVITAHKVQDNGKLWDLARSVRRRVQTSIQSGDPLVFISLLDMLTPHDARPSDFARRASQIYPAPIMVTNLRRIAIPKVYETLSLEKLHFVVSNKAVPNLFNAALVTFADRLTLNFSYVDPVISPEHARSLVEDTMKMLGTQFHQQSLHCM
ncbi:MAG: hypothetical protein HXS41_07350 [Theionarchaea archaeon]|nr:hypothetical protein [Theionarchaea archaeon]MBU7000143.1 hypothetical protein [Theionarchaea archaeon]MBU7020860.1 hypothetical protein [Theionarchaea archaeon]MBU7033904.1 hypothetical protein [Theionarchaea archaeon]MBU7039199.1 hypothetical protein [Theionarchaea archaeon]